ncbi:hypothetical protein BDR07DRAFT_1374456 [Suillus spraguei]|nr:hypothetical protein BDR07DRAFT_1374456 [Suillus spraguei]
MSGGTRSRNVFIDMDPSTMVNPYTVHYIGNRQSKRYSTEHYMDRLMDVWRSVELHSDLSSKRPGSDEPLQLSDSPAPYVNDNERIKHLSEADWSTKNSVEEDDKVEVDQLELHVVHIAIICDGVQKYARPY